MRDVICATCGKANADHLVFCEDCGGRLAPRIAPPTPPIGVPMPPAPEGVRCTRCGATNGVGMRFCITCGTPLAAPAPAPAPAPIAPAPVAVVAPTAAGGETRTCKRCQGTSDKNAQFCRFCGAQLADAPPGPAYKPTMPSASMAAVLSSPVSAPAPAAPMAEPGVVPAVAPVAPKPPAERLDTTIVTTGSPAAEPAAAPPSAGKLVVVHKDGGLGESFPLGERGIDIGRTEGECLFADDRYMATRHARITRKNGSLFVRDLGTANGVYVRLRKETTVPLEDQDLILLGQQVLRFEIVKDAEGGFGAAWERDTLVFGTPAAPRYARLSQRTTEGISCDVFHIRKPETVLGRESGDVVFPDDPFMSRRHASVRANGKSFLLADLGSSNGTFVRLRGEAPLQHGDEIRVGQQLLRVDLG